MIKILVLKKTILYNINPAITLKPNKQYLGRHHTNYVLSFTFLTFSARP